MKLLKKFFFGVLGVLTCTSDSEAVNTVEVHAALDKDVSGTMKSDVPRGQEVENRDASKLMSEEKFWSIINDSERGRTLKKCLSSLSESELFGFDYWWSVFMQKSYRQDLWAAAYVVMGGCGDDSFEYFRYWLIAQGKDVYGKALADVDSLCDVFVNPEEADEMDYPEQEELGYMVANVLEERHGDENYYYNEIEKYKMPLIQFEDIDFEWSEEDEESIRRVCPRIFDKWWGKQSFL